MDKDKLKKLVQFIRKNSEVESMFLSPEGVYNINSYLLLDYISDLFDIPKMEIAGWLGVGNES